MHILFASSRTPSESPPTSCWGCLVCGPPQTGPWAAPMILQIHSPPLVSRSLPVIPWMESVSLRRPLASRCRKPGQLCRMQEKHTNWAFQGTALGKTDQTRPALGLSSGARETKDLKNSLCNSPDAFPNAPMAPSSLPSLLIRNPELYCPLCPTLPMTVSYVEAKRWEERGGQETVEMLFPSLWFQEKLAQLWPSLWTLLS